MFTNECEKGNNGFEEIGYQIFFVVWIIAYWLNVINFVETDLLVPILVHGLEPIRYARLRRWSSLAVLRLHI